jgi:hypothetical protein
MDGFEAVVEHLRSHAGDALQAVIVYRGDEHRDLYRRDDVRERHGTSLETGVLSDVQSDRGRDGDPMDGRGDTLRATVRLFDQRVVLHLPRDATSGTVVVLDTAAASNLDEFVADIRADIYDE